MAIHDNDSLTSQSMNINSRLLDPKSYEFHHCLHHCLHQPLHRHTLVKSPELSSIKEIQESLLISFLVVLIIIYLHQWKKSMKDCAKTCHTFRKNSSPYHPYMGITALITSGNNFFFFALRNMWKSMTMIASHHKPRAWIHEFHLCLHQHLHKNRIVTNQMNSIMDKLCKTFKTFRKVIFRLPPINGRYRINYNN